MNRATIAHGITAALVAIMVFLVGCTNAPPESPCTQAAQDAGLPGGVIDQLRNPEGLDAGEWLELNQVLGEASISGACGKLTAQPDGEPQGVAASQPDGGASDGTPVLQEAEPPGEPTPTPSVVPSARVPEEDDHRRRCRFWALNNLQPIVCQEFSQLEPERMDDLDRILWRSILHPHDHLGFYDDDHARGDEIPTPPPRGSGNPLPRLLGRAPGPRGTPASATTATKPSAGGGWRSESPAGTPTWRAGRATTRTTSWYGRPPTST